MEGKNIKDKKITNNHILILLGILSLIPFAALKYNYIHEMSVFICSFTLEFFIMGFAPTQATYPELDYKKIVRKPVYILIYSVIFTLISVLLCIYSLGLSISHLLIMMMIINILLCIIAIVRRNPKLFNEELNENYSDEDTKPITGNVFAIILFCVLSLISLLLPPFITSKIWWISAAFIVAFIPGYLIINTLLVKKDEIEFLERIGIAIFISLVMTSIIGLILLPFTKVILIRYASVILALIIIFILVPLYVRRSRKINVDDRFTHENIEKLFTVITIISLVALIGYGVYANTQDMTPGNTTFEINGVNVTANEDGYFNFSNDEVLNLTINITNAEHKDMHYKISVQTHNDTDNKEIDSFEADVKNGETTSIPINITLTPGKKDITFILYNDKGEAYKIRHLQASVNEDYGEYEE